MLLVHDVVAGEDGRLARRLLHLLALLQLGNDLVDLVILVGGFLAGAADDERRARFVDQDGVHLVDDAEVVPALHALAQVELHVVAQVVEPELVVRTVCTITRVCGAALLVVEVVHDHADGQAEEVVDFSHPLRVALGQVVIDGDHVDAAPGQRVQVDRQGGDQGFAFAGLHLGNRARVQHHAADQLHVEVTHVERAPAGLAHHGEGLGQNIFQKLVFRRAPLVIVFQALQAFGQALAELVGLGAQLGIGQGLHLRFERINLLDLRLQALDLALVLGAENLGCNVV